MITVVVGKEIEKIKGDFESYLNGLNMVGEISYSQYSELYDEGTKQIQKAYELGKSELEKENAELKGRNAELRGMYVHSAREAGTYKQFLEAKEKENAELKEKYAKNITDCDICDTYCNSQLTKAKEIIKEVMNWYWETDICSDNMPTELRQKAEQFLSEVEK